MAQTWRAGPFEAWIQEVLSWRKIFLLLIGLVIFEKTKAVDRVPCVMLWTCIFFSRYPMLFISSFQWLASGDVDTLRLCKTTTPKAFCICLPHYTTYSVHGCVVKLWRRVVLGLGFAFVGNLVFVTDGRSGYLAFVKVALVYGASLLKRHSYKVLVSFFFFVVAIN